MSSQQSTQNSQSSPAANLESAPGTGQQSPAPPPAAADGVREIIPIFGLGSYVNTLHVDGEETDAAPQPAQNSSAGADLPVTSWRQGDENEPLYGSQLESARVSSSANPTVGSSGGGARSYFQSSTSSDSGRSHAVVNGATSTNGTHN